MTDKSFKSGWDLWNTKIYRKLKFHKVLAELKWKHVLSDNNGQNIVDKFTKLSKIGVFLECIANQPVSINHLSQSIIYSDFKIKS